MVSGTACEVHLCRLYTHSCLYHSTVMVLYFDLEAKGSSSAMQNDCCATQWNW